MPLTREASTESALKPVKMAIGRGYKQFNPVIQPDFEQPPFYQEYFKQWGLESRKK